MFMTRELGEWPDEVSKRLGHESVGSTLDTNSHLLPQRGKEIASEFDRPVEKRRAGEVQKRRLADPGLTLAAPALRRSPGGGPPPRR
jgi:hypothetical protein